MALRLPRGRRPQNPLSEIDKLYEQLFTSIRTTTTIELAEKTMVKLRNLKNQPTYDQIRTKMLEKINEIQDPIGRDAATTRLNVADWLTTRARHKLFC